MSAARALALAAALLAAGCSSPQPADPSVVTSDEDRQLNDAAADLAANALTTDDNQQDDAP